MQYVAAFLVTGVTFALIDAIWLISAGRFYKNKLGNMLLPKPNFVAAAAFYVLFVVGVLIFVLLPALESNDLWQAVLKGALFGLVTYATYDLTNLATLKKWPVKLTILDLIWGMIVTSVSSLAAFCILKGWVF